jgi:hypothetical protein
MMLPPLVFPGPSIDSPLCKNKFERDSGVFQRRSDRFFEHSNGSAVAALRVDEHHQLLPQVQPARCRNGQPDLYLISI